VCVWGGGGRGRREGATEHTCWDRSKLTLCDTTLHSRSCLKLLQSH
jgi:hypothetical protein